MATTTGVVATGATAAAAQQASQAALVSLMLGPIAAAWDLLDTNNLKGTLPQFITAIAALIHRYGTISGSQAQKFYKTERTAAGVPGKITVHQAPLPKLTEVNDSVRWATKGLYSSDPKYAEENMKAARTLVQGVAQRAVLDVGRNTLINAVQNDKTAKGWARVTEPGACSFCILLSTRGMAYRSEQSADFKSHNNCRCFAVPQWSEYKPTAEVSYYQELYKEVARSSHGPLDTRRNFRTAVEDRPFDPSYSLPLAA